MEPFEFATGLSSTTRSSSGRAGTEESGRAPKRSSDVRQSTNSLANTPVYHCSAMARGYTVTTLARAVGADTVPSARMIADPPDVTTMSPMSSRLRAS